MSRKYISIEKLGVFLSNLRSTFADSEHVHDERYYTEAEIDAKMSDVNADISVVQNNVNSHTSNTDIHFSADERTKLSGIEDNAQVNTITGIKGDAEPVLRTGDVVLTKANIGLANVDNTSDANKPVSTAQQDAIDSSLSEAKKYTDEGIAELVGSAPDALNSIYELAEAMQTNDSVVSALNDAVGTKANAADLDTHIADKTNPHDVTVDQLGITATVDELNFMDGVVSNVQDQINSKVSLLGYNATSTDGIAYTATVDGITSLTAGISFVMIPNMNSASTTPTLNVNGLGAKGLRMRGSSGSGTAMSASLPAWISASRAFQVTYNGVYWLAEITRPAASDLTGTVAIVNGGTGATDAATALANLGITMGTAAAESTGTPNSIYIQLL